MPAACRATAGLLLLRPAPARAQSIDYGAAEALFGEPVTNSATGKPQRVSDVPANMESITAEQIRRSGADNLPDILRFVPGLDVRRYGFAAADVGVRGYARPFNPRLLVLVNGQQVYLDDYGRTQWYALPVELDEMRQIEVVKGPNTALFGFNAASGVINIVTWDPLRDRVNSVTARTGTQGYRELSAVGTGQVSDWGGVRVSAGGFQAHDFAPRGLSAADQASRQSPQRGSLAIDGRARVAPGVEVVLNASVVNLRASEQAATVYSSTNAVRTAVTADTRLDLLALSFYRNQSRLSYRGSGVSGDIQDTLYVAQASDTVKLGTSHTVRLGLEYRNSNANASREFAAQVGYQVVSGSLMWDWQVTPTVSVTNAVRLDHFTLNQSGPLLAVSGFTSGGARSLSHQLQGASCLAVAPVVLNISGLLSILTFSDWMAESDKPASLATEPVVVVLSACFLVVPLLGIAGAVMDHHLAIQAERGSDRLRDIADSTMEGILIHRGGRVLDANAAYCALVEAPLAMLRTRETTTLCSASNLP